MARNQKRFKICGSYDTETCNIGSGPESRAYPILFICSDLTEVDLYGYDASEPVHLYRHERDFHVYIEHMIEYGKENEVVPIICAYNLMFDLQPVIYELSCRYRIEANAQSSTHVYTLDLYEDAHHVLRFWDTFHLETLGLAAMGRTCGLAKAEGDWNYSLTRTPDTPLTDEEVGYAVRDVQVIPAYLSWLLRTNEWLSANDLGVRVITKTSLVRQQAVHEVGPLTYLDGKGRKKKISQAYMRTCAAEFPPTYAQYALRKACFRGGWTFTAARYAHVCRENVASFDVTSMHHAFINGRFVPVSFAPARSGKIEHMCDIVCRTALTDVLGSYHMPFPFAFHACVQLSNVRLKKGSVFEAYRLALIPEGKFRASGGRAAWGGPADIEAETAVRKMGYRDAADTPLFAFGKLYAARAVRMHVSEVELWCIAQVYDFDGLRVEYGEVSTSMVRPPDYVTLQSNLLFERKQDMKHLLRDYVEGVPFASAIPASIPEGIAASVRDGSAHLQDLEGYYQSTVKGMFNGIYGVQAQDLMKPTYTCIAGRLEVDRDTVCTRENYDEKKPKRVKSVYHYGLRIVGGSRMHLVAACMLIYEKLGERAAILGGDTDSMKIALDGVTADDVLAVLAPLHEAIRAALDRTQGRVRELYPDIASDLSHVGEFDYEYTNPAHMEAWNKARAYWDGSRVHVVCAGLPRPKGTYTIEDWLSERVGSISDFERIVPRALGYGCVVANDVCHVLERTHPDPSDTIDEDVTDYLGNTYRVRAHLSCALWESSRYLGDMTKRGNVENVAYIRTQGRDVETRERVLDKGGLHYV